MNTKYDLCGPFTLINERFQLLYFHAFNNFYYKRFNQRNDSQTNSRALLLMLTCQNT